MLDIETINIVEYMDYASSITHMICRDTSSMFYFSDLQSCAYLGLTIAINTYDSDRGVPFKNYAALKIRSAVYDGLRSLYCDSRANVKFNKEVSKMKEKNKSDEEISSELGISLKDLSHKLSHTIPFESQWNEYIDSDGRSTPEVDLLIPPEESTIDSTILLAEIWQCILHLSDRDRDILFLMYRKGFNTKLISLILQIPGKNNIARLHDQAIDRVKRILTPRRRVILTSSLP